MIARYLILLFGVAVIATASFAQTAAVDPRQEAFDVLLVKGQKTPDVMTAEEMTKLLQLSQELGRAVTVAPVVRSYFSKHMDVPLALLKLAAENASTAGDYRVAVARYKQYLKVALPGEEARQASLALYRILVDYLVQPEVAFQFMLENGDRVRMSGAADGYDRWYLDRCYEQRLVGAMARRLVSILSEVSPIDQERMNYYYVDRYFERLAAAGATSADAIVPGRALPALIRGSPIRAARAKFLIENLAYRAGAAGKEQSVVEKDFEGVLAAAQAYIDVAPKAATVRDIYTTFSGGAESPSEVIWTMQLAQKQAFFERVAFEKLPDNERAEIMTWNWWEFQRRLATPYQWAVLGSRHVELFKKSAARSTIPLVTLHSNPAVYRAQAQYLQGACSQDAAVINSVAAADDFSGAIKYLLEKESWYGGYADAGSYVENVANKLMPAYNLLPRASTNVFRYEPSLAAFSLDYVFKSPIAVFSVDAASRAMVWVWQYGGATPADKSKFAEQVRLLDWVPYSPEERFKVFEKVRGEVKIWADETRRLYEVARQGKDANGLSNLASRVAQVSQIEAALKQAAETGLKDSAKAPNPICQGLAQVVMAERQKNRDAFVQAGRTLYQAVRDYEIKKTPYGEAILSYLTANRLSLFDTFDFQCEILTDQIGLCAIQGVRRGLSTCVYNMQFGRPGWRYEWGCMTIAPNQDRDMRVKLNGIFVKAVEDRLAAGKFDAQLFNMYRFMRLSEPRDLDLLSKIIEQRVFQKNPGIRYYNSSSATCSYMALIANEFPALAQKYPLASWFDDMFVEEIRAATGGVDPIYWNYGNDAQHKVANALAEHFSQFIRLPYGYDDQPARYNPEQYVSLFNRALNAEETQRNLMFAKIEAAYGTTRFDEAAAGRNSLPYMSVATPDQRRAFFDKLAMYADRSAKAPSPFTLPYLPQLVALEQSKTLTADELGVLVRCFARCWWMPWSGIDNAMDRFVGLVIDTLIERGGTKDLIPMVPMFWRIARETGIPQFQARQTGYAAVLMGKGLADLAAIYSSVGLEIMGTRLSEDSRTALKAVKSKALTSMGGSITVERSDRRYPIFAAQSFYAAGKFDNAWEQYLTGKELALKEYKDLDIDFTTWLVERHVELGEYEAADALGQRLIQWVDSTPQGFDMEARTRLLMAYAGIAFARQEYPRARAQYERIAVSKEFENTQNARLAEIKIADIDRLTKHYDLAIERLEKLRRRPDPVLQAESNYQLALIKYDQDDFAAASDFVNLVFASDMNHANARILEGKLNLRTKKLLEATEVRVGLATDRNTIIPGKPLKVQIEDRNLTIVGRLANIEVRVWTDSGDEEVLSLLPFGDSKTKFEGEMPTALAPQVKGDHILQVLGRDKVHYSFSEQFKKAAGVSVDTVMTIDVISDAELYISSGKILSKEEQEERALERQLSATIKVKVAENAGGVLSSLREDNQIKPGNPISVRVVDPDRSVTATKDQISVRAVTTSGDSVDNVVLDETDTHSGVFEGKIPTATAPAAAFASDSEEGKDPAFAISGVNNPPWVGLADNRRPKSFTVDLNNNLTLERMSVLADVPGRLLKRISVQTSMNGKDFTTLATWPIPIPAWDGYPRYRLVRYGQYNNAPASLSAFKQYLDSDYMSDGGELVCLPGSLADKIGSDVLGQADRIGLKGSGAGSWFIAHVQGVFYVAERKKRTFRVDPKGKLNQINYILTLDGVVGKGPREVTTVLEKGLHQFDIYIGAQRQSQPEFELQCDIPEAPYMARCPMAMFMPANRPSSLPSFSIPVTKIVADTTNNAFNVVFPSNTNARLIRIGIADFEGDAPAIRRVSLYSEGGVQVLPVKEDLLTLRKNKTLEIVPGDRISVIYEDPSSVTKEKRVLEEFMKATFYDATINACYVESSADSSGGRHAQYVPMRRFRAGDPICVMITDADGDISDAQDKLKFKVRVMQGKPIELEALESSSHSGVFIGKFFPVTGDPQRPSEVKIASGEDVVLEYLDEQNTEFGIPWKRTCRVEQAVSSEPEIRVFDFASMMLDTNDLKGNIDAPDIRTGETWPVVRTLVASRPDVVTVGQVVTNLIQCPLIAEIRYPTIALSPISTAKLYVQTSSVLKRAGREVTNGFDVTVPGTLRYEFGPGEAGTIAPPPGYRDVLVRANSNSQDPLDDGRFTVAIPMRLGEAGEGADAASAGESVPGNMSDLERSSTNVSVACVDENGKAATISRSFYCPVLYVRPDDVITLAFEIPGDAGQPSRWVMQQVRLSADAFFDVMDQRYQQVKRMAYMGDRVYLRVADPMGDTTSGKDNVTVKVALARGNVTQSLTLSETFAHSGIFKGSFQAAYFGTTNNSVQTDVVVPVDYGDLLGLSYAPGAGGAPMLFSLQMHKGADGLVMPFTKRFKEPGVAVQTQFTIAEAYFELAKKHRELKQEELARREIAQGKKLLEEAIRDYPETEERAHADYLLANLAMEYAEEIQEPEAKKQRYMEAISRFSDLVSNYSTSPYAPKSQFKKALALDKLGQLDQACEEYVKLSYRYPDNELVAETIARLGQYFMTKGKEWQDKIGVESDPVKKEKAKLQMNDMYRSAARVFERLAVRFPDHALAGKTTVLAAQCWIRASELDRAIEVFGGVIAAKKVDNDLIAQSMYWSGDCYLKKGEMVSAYRVLKRLTWDYPETTWAKYARGRLSEDALSKIEEQDAAK